MIHTKETIEKELRRIQSSVPKVLTDHVISEQHITPTVLDMVDRAIEDPDFPEEKKQTLRNLKELGTFSQKKVVQNEKIAKQIDQYVAREIKKSVKEGRLPTKKQLKIIMETK